MIPLLKKRQSPGLTALGIDAGGVCVATVEYRGVRPALSRLDYHPWNGIEPEKLLTRLSAELGLKNARCTTLLDTTDYSLLLTEAPEAPPEELRAALRWRIKDMIDFHINDATLDVFDVPGERTPGRPRPMYAVAARSSAIQKRVDQMDMAGISLDVIDIPEMAQRNLAGLLPQDAKGVAFLSFDNQRGLLTISRQGELYLSRVIEIGLERLTGDGDRTGWYDRIVLEVQRSLDYYESHFRQAPVAALALGPLSQPLPELFDYLRANLNVPIEQVDLGDYLDGTAPRELQARCLSTIGAALRQETATL
jgi:MSHA biogenesis protein MshI